MVINEKIWSYSIYNLWYSSYFHKEFEKFTNKRHIYSNALNQKETITNSNKLYRWGKNICVTM